MLLGDDRLRSGLVQVPETMASPLDGLRLVAGFIVARIPAPLSPWGVGRSGSLRSGATGDLRGELVQRSDLIIEQRNLGFVIILGAGLLDLGLRLVQLRLTQLDD